MKESEQYMNVKQSGLVGERMHGEVAGRRGRRTSEQVIVLVGWSQLEDD